MRLMKNKKISRLLAVATLASAFLSVNSAFAISKCQDANGKWHYGTSVSSKCAKSEITKLNDRGIVKDKVAAPKTPEELAAEKSSADEAEKIRLIEQAERDQKNRILSVYEKEDDIERARQNNLRSINQQVVLRKAYINSLKENQALKLKKVDTVSSVALKKRLTKQAADIDIELEESRKSSLELEEKIKQVNIQYDEELTQFRKYKLEEK